MVIRAQLAAGMWRRHHARVLRHGWRPFPRERFRELGPKSAGLPNRALVHRAAADDQVDQHADQRDEQHEQEPQSLAPAGQVRAAEDVDENGDQDPEPDHPQEDFDDGPENVQQRIRR